MILEIVAHRGAHEKLPENTLAAFQQAAVMGADMVELALSERCPGLASDLLYPPSEPWKTLDIVAYEAKHLGRLARARAVHLHHTQLSEQVVAGLAAAGLETHVWGANDENALQQCRNLGQKRACTDQLSLALGWRSRAAAEASAAPE